MFYSNRRRIYIHVEVENSKFSRVNGEFYGIQLTLVWPHIIITCSCIYLRIQSLDLADIRSHPILCVCLRYLQVSNDLDQKQARKGGDTIIALIRLQIIMFASSSPDIRSYSFTSIRTVQEVLRILETCS